MSYESILAAIDSELSTLQNARQILASTQDALTIPLDSPSKRGRSKGSTKSKPTAIKKRTMSAEGRAKIAEAQRKRHAAKKRADRKAAKEATQTETPSE